jgi:hypothetical protein
MIDVVNKKCRCGLSRPSFNEPGESGGICCSICKTNMMVNVVDRQKCKCGLAIPSFNEPGESTALCCASCKTDTMVNVKAKYCKCGKSLPSFNEPGEKTPICCASCKSNTMVDVKSRVCHCGKSRPYYNEPGESTPICCVSCKSATMVNVVSAMCPGMSDHQCPYNHFGNRKYKNYCTECFRRQFPLDPLTFQIHCKTKEIAVRDFINSVFQGFQHDRPLETSHCECNVRRRIDHRKIINNTLLAIETDENQHKSYNKMDEETRYDDLYMAYSGKWIYIRFNPDKYKLKNGKFTNPSISKRLEQLQLEIEKQIKRIENEENTDLVERVYMYYNEE